jgi:hypothetical protein
MKMSLLSSSDSGMLALDHGWQFLPASFSLEMMWKLNIHDSVTLVRYAIRAGIIDP